MLKTKTKFITAFALMLIIIGLLNVTTVNATDDKTQAYLDAIPSEMSLDIPEAESDKVSTLVEENLKAIWQSKNLSTEGLNIMVGYYPFSMQKFYTVDVYFEGQNNTIKLKFNNTDKKSKTDEDYVKNIKLTSPKYYEVPLDYLAINDDQWENKHNEYFGLIAKSYKNQIKDNTITIELIPTAGGTDGALNLWTWESGTVLKICKNGFVYDIRTMGQECTVPVINIPNNIADNEINSYITSQITKYYKNFGENITSIVKGTTGLGVNITDGYTIESKYAELASYIIAKKDKSTNTAVTKTDETTGIKLDASTNVIPSNTQLVVKSLTKGDTYNTIVTSLGENTEKFVAYDITLINDNVTIQPNGKLKISLPIPDGYDTSKIAIYRIAEDGTKTKYDVTIDGNYAIIETDHFSTYVISEEKQDEQNPTTTETKQGEKDNTPKTGTNNIIIYVLGTVSLVGIGTLAIKKYNK